MQSALLEKYRSALVIKEFQSKTLGAFEVRIKTAYAGISFTDVIIQQGLYKYQRTHMPLPYVPGFEASGTVIGVGSQASEYSIGDKVVVLQRAGCLSSEIVAQQGNVIKLPSDTNLKWAASIPVNYFTASHALHNIVNIFPGSDILVTSAAGGVGGMLTQLAIANHTVTGLVGRQEKKKYVRNLGVSEVYTYEELYSGDKTFDVIFVASGKDLNQYYKKLNTNGKLVVYGFHSMVPQDAKSIFSAIFSYIKLPKFSPFNLVYENKTISGFNIIHLDPHSKEFRYIKKQFLDFLATGVMPKKQKIHSYVVEDVNQALADLARSSVEGKVVIKF